MGWGQGRELEACGSLTGAGRVIPLLGPGFLRCEIDHMGVVIPVCPSFLSYSAEMVIPNNERRRLSDIE